MFLRRTPEITKAVTGVEPRAAVQDTSPITKGEARQVNHPAAQDRTTKTKGLRISAKLCKLSKRNYDLSPYFEFKCNSALNKEGNSNKFACWPNKGVQRELGLANSGSLGTANSSGVSATTYGQPVQISAPPPPTVADVARAAGPGINRDTDNGTAGSEGLCLPDISGSQKGWRPPSCSELEGPEQVHSGGALQDGGLSHGEGFGETWGLVGQNRSEGCLLSGTSRPQSPEVPSVSVAGQPLSVPLPTVRPILCPSHLHEVDEASGCLSERERNQTDHISGRSIDPVQLSRYPDQTSGVYQGLISDVGSDYHQQQVPVGTITRACVHGSGNFDCIDASVFTQRESGPDPTGGQTVTFKVGSVSTEASNLCGHDDSGKTGYPGGSTVSSALASSHKQSGAISILVKQSYHQLVRMSVEATQELKWWMQEIQNHNGAPLLMDPPDLVIESDASRLNLKRSRTEDRGSVVD